MSEVDLPVRLANYGADNAEKDYILKRIALTHADIQDGKLPPFEAETKKDDPRYKWFVSRYGESCWELDAMDPNELRDRLGEEIEMYINPADWQTHKQIEEAQRQTTKQIAEAMRQAT